MDGPDAEGWMPMKLYTVKVMANCLDLSERRVRQLREEGILIEAALACMNCGPMYGDTSTSCGATQTAKPT